MRRPSTLPLCIALTALVSTACDTTPAETKTPTAGEPLVVQQPFPTQSRLDALGSEAVETPLARVGTLAAVTSWTIDPAEAQADWTLPYTGDEPNAKAFAAWLPEQAPKVRSSASVSCMAHQYARFNAEHPGAVAGEDVKAFMQSRCGIPFLGVQTFVWTLPADKFQDLDPGRPEPTVIKTVQGFPDGAFAGMGVAKTEDKVILVAASTSSALQLTPVAFDAGESGEVIVRGQYNVATEWMQAAVTYGPLGVQGCDPLTEAGEPGSFAFRCKTKPDDAQALIEITAANKGAVLGRDLARIYLSPNGAMPGSYAPPTLELPVTQGDFGAAAVIAGINTLRHQAGLADVRTTAEQNAVSTNLFPHLVGNTEMGVRNEAAMGLMAGWQIPDVVRDARFSMMFAHDDLPLAQVLAADLLFPSFRATVLSEDIDSLSTAVLDDPDQGVRGLLHVAYEMFEPESFAAEELAFLDALDSARAKVDLPPVMRAMGGDDEDAMAQSADRIRTGESTPRQELDGMVAYFADRVKRDFFGVMYTPMRLDGWTPQFDDELFKHERIAVAAAVTYFQPPNAAWGQHVVFLVYTPL